MLNRHPLAWALVACALLSFGAAAAATKKAPPASAASVARSESAVRVLTDEGTGTVRVIVKGEEILRAEESGYYEVRVPRAAVVAPKSEPCGAAAKESTKEGAGRERRSHD